MNTRFPGDSYILEGTAMRNLERVMRRLYDETKLSGDERRDLANAMDANLDGAIDLTWKSRR